MEGPCCEIPPTARVYQFSKTIWNFRKKEMLRICKSFTFFQKHQSARKKMDLKSEKETGIIKKQYSRGACLRRLRGSNRTSTL